MPWTNSTTSAEEIATATSLSFAALADREPAPEESLPVSTLAPELARKLSAPFVLDPTYGTRCSTVLTISHDDELLISERRFDAHGDPAGESEYALNGGA